jgi:formylglycine-generating enzyme required for sulfatase activity
MTEPPSCNGSATAGINDCASEAAGESCCASLEVAGVVAGQSFYRVYDVNDAGMTIPVDGGVINEAEPATVSAFRLDKYLVTVGRFRQFVNILYPGGQPASTGTLAWSPQVGSGKHTHLNGGKGLVSVGADGGTVYEQGWMPGLTQLVQPTSTALACQMGTLLPTWTDMPGSGESLPINCVTWSEAYAFCIWDGGFLPSEAEWAYAAAGGAMQREYPWGWESPGTANKYAIYNCDYPSGHGACQGLANLAPVGTAPDGAGLWGQLDLAGELYEWALDLFAPLVTPCDDCADLSAETGSRVLRGNGYESSFGFFLNHKGVDPEDRSAANGFRCARTP